MHGFTSALTSFVGRAEAVREVAGLLEDNRLVTVTGPGGSGKTRLARKVSERVADRFADGVWLVELSGVRSPARVPAAVAAALGVTGLRRIPVAGELARVLALQQQLLLVLDSCEHVIEAVAELCAGLLPACDDLRVLATSRGPLRVAGEARYRLASLTLPRADDPANVMSEAVALFADRARRVDARFALDDRTGPVVGRLVERLDGMPLAIELAAARVEALGVSQLLDRIDDRFALLTAGDRLATARQRSLAAMVQWSYRLLGEDEQRVFRMVSLFPGPFTLEAAEAVAGEGAGPAVLDLVDCSLLAPPRVDPDGRSRYTMLETLRMYGAGLLAKSGEQDPAAAALAGYAAEVAKQADAGLATSTGEPAALRWLDAEEGTMRQALTWAMAHDQALALRLAVALAPWCFQRGRLHGESLLRQAAEQAKPGSDAWCTLQFWLGWSALYAADLTGGLAYFTAVRDTVAGQRPPPVLADCLAGRAAALTSLGRPAEAVEDGQRAMALARELGSPAGEGMAIVALALAASYANDQDGVSRLGRQAEQLTGEIPGWVARAASHILTFALTTAGDLAAAERHCAAGLARAREVGDLRNLATGLNHMVRVDLAAGRLQDAAANLREELQLAMRTGNRVDAINALNSCGHLCAATGRPADAITAWAAYEALFRQDGFKEAPADAARRAQPLRQARDELGESRARAAEDRGTSMSMATASEYVLLLTSPAPPPQAPAELGGLSDRERELVTLVARGLTDAQIAAELFISVRTVGSHLDRIRNKTGARRRADLTRLALSAGLV